MDRFRGWLSCVCCLFLLFCRRLWRAGWDVVGVPCIWGRVLLLALGGLNYIISMICDMVGYMLCGINQS